MNNEASVQSGAGPLGVFEPGSVAGGRYLVGDELACRPSAHVFQAVQQETGAAVTLKVTLDSREQRGRLEREAEVSERLQGLVDRPDGGLILQSDWFTDFGLVVQVLKAPGGKGPFQPFGPRQGSLPERLQSLAKLARLVRELHRNKVVHCDLRPRHWRSDPRGRLLLTGFGWAISKPPARVDLGNSLASPDHPSYVAPECFLGEEVDERADVYSLGAMLFEVLTAQVPYPGRLAAISRQHATVLAGARPPVPQGIEKAHHPLARLCVKAIFPDPAERPALAAIVEALEAATGGANVPAPVRGPKSTSRHRVQRPAPRVRSTERHARPAPGGPVPGGAKRAEARLKKVADLLPKAGAASVTREGDTLSCTVVHWSRAVPLRFRVDASGNWGSFDRRSKIDMSELENDPHREAALRYAVNAFNRAGLGTQLRLGSDALVFSRTVLLGGRVSGKKLAGVIDGLLRASFAGIGAIQPVCKGAPWHESVAALNEAKGEAAPEELDDLQRRLTKAKLEVRRDGKALVCQHQGDEARISCAGDDLRVRYLAVAAPVPRASIKLKLGESIEACEALCKRIDRENLGTPATLYWDPKRGVVSAMTAHAPSCGGDDLRFLLDRVREIHALDELEALCKAIEA